MAYQVLVDPAAQRELKMLPGDVRQRVANLISSLEREPRPAGVKKLGGSENSYRLRVGDFRILYRIEDRKLVVLVVRVAHRRDVYR